MTGKIPALYQRMTQKRDIDYLLIMGDVPTDIVTHLNQHHGLPSGGIVAADSATVKQWQESRVHPATGGPGLHAYDLAFHLSKKGMSALPIPMAALTGEVPAFRDFTSGRATVSRNAVGNDRLPEYRCTG